MSREKGYWTQLVQDSDWTPEFPDKSMYDMLAGVAAEIPTQPALYFEGAVTTYRRMMDNIDRVALSLAAAGVEKGDIISLIAPNMPQAVYTFYAANKMGVTVNLIHPLMSQAEIRSSIERSKSKIVVILDQIYPKIAKLKWDIEPPLIVLLDVTDALPLYARPVYVFQSRKINKGDPTLQKTIKWKEFLSRSKGGDAPMSAGSGADVAAIMYSGGVTGTPKGVMLTNNNFNHMFVQLYDVSSFSYFHSGQDPKKMKLGTLALVPIFHGFGLGICIHAMLLYGSVIYLMAKFDFEKSVKLVFKKKMQLVYAVPAFFEVMARSPEIEKQGAGFMEIVVSGGDRLPPELQERFNGYLRSSGSNALLREAYGQTECVCACAINPYIETRPGSVGVAFPDTELKIVRPGTCEEVAVGEEGELCVSAPNVMKGYFDDPEETAKVLKTHEDGKVWLHTGDAFVRDAEGYYYFKQRLSRMIITSGYNIYLTQIEEVVNSVAGVRVSCAVGVDDKVVGKRVDLFVEPKDADGDIVALEREIRERCLGNLAEYSQPNNITFLRSMSRNTMGKVDYNKIATEGVQDDNRI